MHTQEFKLKPSMTHAIWLGFMLISSIVLVFLTPMPGYLKIILSIIMLSYGMLAFWRQIGLKGAWALVALHYRAPQKTRVEMLQNDKHHSDKEALWRLQFNQSESAATLRGDSTVTRFVSILRFNLQGQKRAKSYVIFRDSLSPGEYRKLLVILRML